MAKKTRKHVPDLDFDSFDEFSDFDEEDFELKELAGATERDWDEYDDPHASFSARRKIERHRDMRKLYSQLDDWEEYGEPSNW